MSAHILVPLDGSSIGEEILPYLRQLAHRLSIPAELLVIVEPPPPSISRDLNPQLHEHETVAHRTGDAQNYLNAVAKELQADGLSVSINTLTTLIAMCGHGRAGVSRSWLGSVTKKESGDTIRRSAA